MTQVLDAVVLHHWLVCNKTMLLIWTNWIYIHHHIPILVIYTACLKFKQNAVILVLFNGIYLTKDLKRFGLAECIWAVFKEIWRFEILYYTTVDLTLEVSPHSRTGSTVPAVFLACIMNLISTNEFSAS